MNNDTIKLIRKTSNVNSLMVIIFYMLDIALIRLGDLAVYHIAGKSAYYEDIAQLGELLHTVSHGCANSSCCIQTCEWQKRGS